jgi:hypothetical protein
MKRFLSILGFTVLLAGCTTPGHVHEGDPAKISVGMTRDELVRKIGKPETVAADGNAEILGYTLERPWWQVSRFQVKLVDGRVKSYEVTDR